MNPAIRRVLETLLTQYLKRLNGDAGTITMKVHVNNGSIERLGISVDQ